MGLIMMLGHYTDFFYTSVNPWTTLGPLAIVVSISLIQEGLADYARHRSDKKTNSYPCLLLKRLDELRDRRSIDPSIMNGEAVSVEVHKNSSNYSFTQSSVDTDVVFSTVKREEIYAGNLVLVRNREMVPADIVLLASSNENGSAYIETSSIDGETNLKLRTCPNLEIDVGSKRDKFEGLEDAIKRLCSFSSLVYPKGIPSIKNPNNPIDRVKSHPIGYKKKSALQNFFSLKRNNTQDSEEVIDPNSQFVATLTSEMPNASVNTFSGKITLPPPNAEEPGLVTPLGSENLLLRGAMLRNTEWAIGVTCFAGKDTKLVQNSVKTPSKFSRLDVLVNITILLIVCAMILLCFCLAIMALREQKAYFQFSWYLGQSADPNKVWPYLKHLPPPENWTESSQPFFPLFLTFITQTNNFVPLSLYMTVELAVAYLMWILNNDRDMYHEETDTPAAARSTIVSDLGQIKYIFSDKTGTLTQNVMKFKRCCVDGLIYGDPLLDNTSSKDSELNNNEESGQDQSYSPLDHLIHETQADDNNLFLAPAAIETQNSRDTSISYEIEHKEQKETDSIGGSLTLNAEMFLRVMSICHTVVVEKEYDQSKGVGAQSRRENSNAFQNFFMSPIKKRLESLTASQHAFRLEEFESQEPEVKEEKAPKKEEEPLAKRPKNKDGAPMGYAYEAESPDEAALVSAASLEYGFQLLGRDMEGIRVACASPSILRKKHVTEGLKNGTFTLRDLASNTALLDRNVPPPQFGEGKNDSYPEEEVWSILATNKFDSDRKRSSILVRSPPELGSLPILFCKGADTTMLTDSVCEKYNILETEELQYMVNSMKSFESMSDVEHNSEWEIKTALGVQVALGDFATEGLRTLVLGMRVLTEDECEAWLKTYTAAIADMNDRDRLCKEAANEIETKLHIVGATAIEDKLQDKVPETISTLADAGIKLWVLTGDKRETAINIGYSTQVLTPSMRVIQIADAPSDQVKFRVAREFLGLVKNGFLPEFQRAELQNEQKSICRPFMIFVRVVSRCLGMIPKLFNKIFKVVLKLIELIVTFGRSKSSGGKHTKTSTRLDPIDPYISRKKVRDLADDIILAHKEKSEFLRASMNESGVDGKFDDDEEAQEDTPAIFNRSNLAKEMLQRVTSSNSMQPPQEFFSGQSVSYSMPSVRVNKDGPEVSTFDPKKRSILEWMFAIDTDMREGRLRKHVRDSVLLNDENKGAKKNQQTQQLDTALVIEGSALIHILGDPLLEEMLFSVAKNCKSVIACRVSPKQKALLVNLVRNYVRPEPVTLAIGDGANDVGMIQKAHVGVGISGLEGQQAVNSSDFAIAQFRFLRQLILIHGRWNFIRLSKVVLFSFYKNALLVALLSTYNFRTLFSGTTIYDSWVISMLNFLASWPILFVGMFDRDLEKDYILRNPELYKPGPRNENFSMRMILRWVSITVIHGALQYVIAMPIQSWGGTQTSAFEGMMSSPSLYDHPGDGEADLKVIGVVMFTILIFTLAYKVRPYVCSIYETHFLSLFVSII